MFRTNRKIKEAVIVILECGVPLYYTLPLFNGLAIYAHMYQCPIHGLESGKPCETILFDETTTVSQDYERIIKRLAELTPEKYKKYLNKIK
jgi:hypothetical protein